MFLSEAGARLRAADSSVVHPHLLPFVCIDFPSEFLSKDKTKIQ